MLYATEQLTAVRKAVCASFKDREDELRDELMLRESQEYDRLYWEK